MPPCLLSGSGPREHALQPFDIAGSAVTTLSVPLPSPHAADVSAERPLRSAFIVSPLFDGFFFFASAAAVLIAWFAAAQLNVRPFYILAAVAVVSNGPHLVSTWTRVYMDRREWRTRPFKITVVPLLIAGVVVSLVLLGRSSVAVPAGITSALASLGFVDGRPILLDGNRMLHTALLYWAVWHFVAQCWGLLRIYQNRSGEPYGSLALRLEKPMLFTFVAWCLLHRLQTGPRRLFGTELYYPTVSLTLVNLLLGASVALAAAWVLLRVIDRQNTRRHHIWLRAAFLGSCVVGFAVPFLLITTDDTTGFAAAACWHGLQYLGIIRFYHRTAWKNGVHPDAKAISWISQPGKGRLFLYVALLLALAGSGYVLIWTGSLLTAGTKWNAYTWGSVVWLSFTFSHYYLDGVIWKVSRDKVMASRLKLNPS